MNTRKYYVKVPAAFSYSGEPYWKELCQVENVPAAPTPLIAQAKTLSHAQYYVEKFFAGLSEPEIAVSINGGDKTVVSKKNKEGKWEVVLHQKRIKVADSNPYANDQIQYHLGGKLVSQEDFFKYGFRHEK